jgi:hypothetical protein
MDKLFFHHLAERDFNMMEDLNKLEYSILERLASKYPFVKEHIPFIKVESRLNTGVGMYINLAYNNPSNKELKVGMENTSVSTNEVIQIDGLKYGLTYEVDISDEKIKFIELVTNGEDWDGKVSDNFIFTK